MFSNAIPVVACRQMIASARRAPAHVLHSHQYFLFFPWVLIIFTGIEATVFTIFGLRFLGLDGPYLTLHGPLLALPSLQFNSLDALQSGSDVFLAGSVKMQFFEPPLKRCASTRAFEWYQFRVIWRSRSKVMAKLLKSPHVRYPPCLILISRTPSPY